MKTLRDIGIKNGAEEGDEDCINALEYLNQPKQPTIIRIDRNWIKNHCKTLRQEGRTQTDCLFCEDTVSVKNYLKHHDKQHKGESLVEFEWMERRILETMMLM